MASKVLFELVRFHFFLYVSTVCFWSPWGCQLMLAFDWQRDLAAAFSDRLSSCGDPCKRSEIVFQSELYALREHVAVSCCGSTRTCCPESMVWSWHFDTIPKQPLSAAMCWPMHLAVSLKPVLISGKVADKKMRLKMTSCHFTFSRSSDSIVRVVGHQADVVLGHVLGQVTRGKGNYHCQQIHAMHVLFHGPALGFAKSYMRQQLQCFKECSMHMGFLCIRLILLYSTVCMHASAIRPAKCRPLHDMPAT